MIISLTLLFAAIYSLLDGFHLLDPKTKIYFVVATGLLTIPSNVASILLYCKGLARTKHGKWRYLFHSYLKTAFDNHSAKYILFNLPKVFSYCDFFSCMLAEGNNNLLVFGCKHDWNRVDVVVPQKKLYSKKFILCSIFITKLRIKIKNNLCIVLWPEEEATIRDVQVKVSILDNGVLIKFKNHITGVETPNSIIRKGEFSPTSVRMFEYTREMMNLAKERNCYLVEETDVKDIRNLNCLRKSQFIKNIETIRNYKLVYGWKSSIGGPIVMK